MNVAVFSDTHRDTEDCIKVINNIVGVDMIIHAGDHLDDAKKIKNAFPDIAINFVAGNCDFGTGPKELVFHAGGKKIFLTHGHLYNVKNDYGFSALLSRAKSLGCDCAVFGHTHEPLCDIKGSITLLNPGSIKSSKTFGVIEIENGVLKAAVCNA